MSGGVRARRPRRGPLGALLPIVVWAGSIGAEVERPPSPDAPYRIVRPATPGPHRTLLFVSGCSGFTPHEAPGHYGRVAEGFAAQGFVVIFVDYLGARGREACGGTIHPADIVGDILAAAAYARTRPFVRASDVTVVGWSMGGGGVLAAIAGLPAGQPTPFRRAIAFYPVCWGIETPWRARIPLLLLLAGLDEVSSTPACQQLVARLGPDPPITVRLYPDARHAFDVPDLPPLLRRSRGTVGHDPAAAAASREAVREFLTR